MASITAGAWTSKLRTERKVAKILNACCYLLYLLLACRFNASPTLTKIKQIENGTCVDFNSINNYINFFKFGILDQND